MTTRVRAYAITAAAIEAEHRRVDGDMAAFDASRVVALDEITLPPLGAADVQVRTLVRGGKIFPGNSAVGEVVAVGSAVTRFRPGDVVVTHGEQFVAGEWQLIPAPLDCGLNL